MPPDNASSGFDNIADLLFISPTAMESYLGAAEKISRLAIGSPTRSPGGDTVTLPPDLTQEQHFDDLPLGTRGGLAIHYTFPLDAEYEIRVRLQRDRNEHVEGLTEAHDIELMLDGERLKLFTVKPPPRNEGHAKVDAHLKARLTVTAGPHDLGVTFLKNPFDLPENYKARSLVGRAAMAMEQLLSCGVDLLLAVGGVPLLEPRMLAGWPPLNHGVIAW